MTPVHFKTISEFHKGNHLPPPAHPLISVVDYSKVAAAKGTGEMPPVIGDYYIISVKRGLETKMRYGQQPYDFDEGVMYLMAPGQVLKPGPAPSAGAIPTGWILVIHPDFLWGSHLAKTIRQYAFFDYAVNEALFLSGKEEATLNGIVHNITTEYLGNVDKFSQSIILSHIETLLNYAERFYQRQFITRKVANHDVLYRMEQMLSSHLSANRNEHNGLPTVQQLADALNLSTSYLSSLLKSLTGQTAQQHIHNKVIEVAKGHLSSSALSVSEIAYCLGFEHSQSFSKFFKSKTNVSPLEFRRSFN